MDFKILFMAALGMTWPTNCTANGIAGLTKLHWGMTKQQVEAVYPNFEQWNESKFNPLTGREEDEHKYGSRQYIAVCRFALNLEFLDNRLGVVSLVHPSPTPKGHVGEVFNQGL